MILPLLLAPLVYGSVYGLSEACAYPVERGLNKHCSALLVTNGQGSRWCCWTGVFGNTVCQKCYYDSDGFFQTCDRPIDVTKGVTPSPTPTPLLTFTPITPPPLETGDDVPSTPPLTFPLPPPQTPSPLGPNEGFRDNGADESADDTAQEQDEPLELPPELPSKDTSGNEDEEESNLRPDKDDAKDSSSESDDEGGDEVVQ